MLALPVSVLSVRVEAYFQSLCKMCQIHVAALQDDLFHMGLELDEPTASTPVFAATNFSIDFYGRIPSNSTCEMAAEGTEHGPDMCVTDRYHLCAQHSGAPHWFDYTHCMMMNIDSLKCHRNGHCPSRERFYAALGLVHPMCAVLSGVDAEAIQTCANSPEAVELQKLSYARTQQRTQGTSFAPIFVDGKKLDVDRFWRKTPDSMYYGQQVLEAVCSAAAAQQGVTPTGCDSWSADRDRYRDRYRDRDRDRDRS